MVGTVLDQIRRAKRAGATTVKSRTLVLLVIFPFLVLVVGSHCVIHLITPHPSSNSSRRRLKGENFPNGGIPQ